MKYDEWDNPVRQMNAAGVETRFTYDALGRELTRTRAGAVWKREYGTDGRVANSTDPLSAVTHFFYNTSENPMKTRATGRPGADPRLPNFHSRRIPC